VVVIVMGVSGCGKSTVGRLLAERTSALFLDADDFHPPANVAKMRAGTPLTDEDRAGWLRSLRDEIETALRAGTSLVLACSALRDVYRRALARPGEDVRFVHLVGTFESLHARLAERKDHYMPPALLRSQFATLEPPPYAVEIAADERLDASLARIVQRLRADEGRIRP
jgi:gluconokinase